MKHIYPQDMPLECIVELTNIIRSGKIIEDLDVFANEAWWVQGWIQGKLLGGPKIIGVTAEEESNVDLKVALVHLCTALDDSLEPVMFTGPLVNVALGIILKQLLALLIEKLPEILEKWLKEQKNDA